MLFLWHINGLLLLSTFYPCTPSFHHHHHTSLSSSLFLVSPFFFCEALLEERGEIETSARMRTPMMIMKQEFIKKWTIALKTCCRVSSKDMCVIKKQKAIKQTAAIAMAAAKRGSTAWSRAILSDGRYDQKNNEILLETLMGSQDPTKSKRLCVKSSTHISSINLKRSKRSSRMRTRRPVSKNYKVMKASSLAESIIKKQAQVLKRLIPGGEYMDECCLIEEALDYVVSLKAQVDVMKELVIAAEHMKKAY